MNEAPLPHLSGNKGVSNFKQSKERHLLAYSVLFFILGIVLIDRAAGKLSGGNYGSILFSVSSGFGALFGSVALFVAWRKQQKEDAND